MPFTLATKPDFLCFLYLSTFQYEKREAADLGTLQCRFSEGSEHLITMPFSVPDF